MKTTNTESGFSRAVTIVLSLIFIVGLASLYYIFYWRPTDQDVQLAINHTNTLKEDVDLFSKTFASGRPPVFEPSSYANFFKRVNGFQSSFRELEETSIIRQGLSAKQEFENNKDLFVSYGNRILATSKAVKVYYDLSGSCGVMRFSNFSGLTDQQLSDCREGLDEFNKLPASGFKTNFLNDYSKQLRTMVYILYGTGAELTDEQREIKFSNTKDGLEKLFSGEYISYELEPSPYEALGELQELLESQKSAFLR